MRTTKIAAITALLCLATLLLPPSVSGQRGGRGRGPVQVMTLTAPWAPGAEIPLKHTQAGDETSPALTWSNVPDTAGSFVLIVHDVSAPVNPGTDDVLHWMVWNIPAATRSLPEGVPQGPELPDGSRQISVTGPNYRGPGAPASGPPHVYVFELYALDGMLDIPALGPEGATVAQTRAAVMAAMAGRVRGKAVTVGTFQRKWSVEQTSSPQDQFWANLKALCGAAAAGVLRQAPPGDTQIDPKAALVVHFWECGDTELRFPLHVGDNRSRTWVFIRHADHLELRHDHRRADGTEDTNTWYGATTLDAGSATRQDFVTERNGMRSGWRLEIVPGQRFAYGTARNGEWRHHLEFDLTAPVAVPPRHWGHETRPSQRKTSGGDRYQ